ncbi:MAG: cell division GTPase FtsZ [Verrucomicrobiota bacterium]|jgi:cell division protein FtsZ
MSHSELHPPSAGPVPGVASIKVLGVGGAGGNAVGHMARQSFAGVDFAALNTDAVALAHATVPTRLSLGARSMRGLGSGGDPARGRAAAEEEAAAIRSLCQGAQVVFVVAGLGGGTGTGAGPVVARLAKECGALVLGIALLPFECEGTKRAQQAQRGLEELKEAADGVICLPNQRMFKLVDEKTSVLEAFQITNDLIAQGVRGIWSLLSRPGLINVDFADLCSVTQGRHTESALATAEARGEHRSREVMERLLAHPLMEGGAALADATGVLVCLRGGPGLSLAEVNHLTEQVRRQCEGAHLILGAAIDDSMGDGLSVTLLAAKSAPPLPASLPVMAPAPAVLAPAANPAPPAAPMLLPTSSQLVPDVRPETEPVPAPGLGSSRRAKGGPRLRQGQLALELLSKGRFEKSEPTIHQGQDLDLPTYIRRGVALN